jgi:hypothetical protein
MSFFSYSSAHGTGSLRNFFTIQASPMGSWCCGGRELRKAIDPSPFKTLGNSPAIATLLAGRSGRLGDGQACQREDSLRGFVFEGLTERFIHFVLEQLTTVG